MENYSNKNFLDKSVNITDTEADQQNAQQNSSAQANLLPSMMATDQ